MVLLRRMIGDALRARRQGQHRTLREVSSAANVSLGYLSEIERGQKEPSSELLAAVCDALGARLSELLRDVSDTVELAEQLPSVLVPVQERPATERGTPARPESAPPAAAEPVRHPVHAEPVRESVHAEPVHAESVHAEQVHAEQVHAEQVHAEQVRQPALAEAAASRPAMADAAVRSLAEGGVRQVATDGTVSVTVRQESPLKTTLRTTRRVRSTSHDRGIVCAA